MSNAIKDLSVFSLSPIGFEVEWHSSQSDKSYQGQGHEFELRECHCEGRIVRRTTIWLPATTLKSSPRGMMSNVIKYLNMSSSSPIGFEVQWHTSQSDRNSHNWRRIFSISSGNMQTNALVMPAILPPSPVLKSRLTSSCKRSINRCSFSIRRKKCKFVYVKCSVKKVILFLMTPTHRRNSWNHLLHNNHQVSQTRPIQPKQIAILHPPIRFSQRIRLYGKCKQKQSWKKKRCLPEFAWYNLCTTYI